jgi:hypothetical protein
MKNGKKAANKILYYLKWFYIINNILRIEEVLLWKKLDTLFQCYLYSL